jgi:hypothetical protein
MPESVITARQVIHHKNEGLARVALLESAN